MHSLNLANSSVILHRSLAARWAHENFQVFCWSCELHFATNYRFIAQVTRELIWTFPSMSSICCSAVNILISIECVWVDDFTNKNKLNLAVVGRRVEFQILSFEQHPFPRGIRSVLAVYPILNKCSKKSSSSSTKGRTMWQRMSSEFFPIPANWHFIENENWQRKLKSLQVNVSSVLHQCCLSWALNRLRCLTTIEFTGGNRQTTSRYNLERAAVDVGGSEEKWR